MAQRSNLPAPYESPWRQLGQALRAVAASLGLDLRGLWRRNGSGELWRPGFWPRRLSALFWPLALLGAMAVVSMGVLALTTPWQREPVQTAAITAEPAPAMPESTPPVSVAEPPGVSEEPSGSQQPEQSEPPARPEAPALPESLASADPLLDQLDQVPGRELIAAAVAQAEQGLLQLQLRAAFGQLHGRRQGRLAEAWLEQSLLLGFDQLALIDDQGQPLGYRARVGSGMILLDPAATS